MRQFNKYKFISELKEGLSDQYKELKENDVNESEAHDFLQEYIHTEIEREIIYYSYCCDIISELRFYDFSNNNSLGMEINNISQAAYVALMELVNDEISIDKIINK
jgi:hypothetical protein